MATTNFSTSSSSTVKLWSERTLFDFCSDLELLGSMMKAGIVQRQDETSRMAGDRVTVSFLNRLTDQGLLGSAAATGNESALTYATDNLLINQLRIPVSIPAPNTIDTQRVNYDLPEDTYRVMSEWMRVRGALGVLNQLAGNTASTINYDGQAYSGNDRLKLTGLNSAVAPSTTSGVTRIIRPNSLTTDQAVAADSTATFKLSFIDTMEKIAMQSRPYIRPLSETGGIKYHLYLHTEQFEQCLQDTTAPMQYRDIMLARMAGGKGDGEIPDSFVYNHTKIFRTDKIPKGVNSSTGVEVDNTRRAVFCGREAAGIAFGQGFSDGQEAVPGFRINHDYYDIGQQSRYALVGVFGIKKLQFESNDHGSIVLTTYSAS